MKKQSRISISMPEEYLKCLEDAAKKQDRSISAVIRRMIEAQLMRGGKGGF